LNDLEDENENEVKVQKKEKKVDIPLNFGTFNLYH